MRPLHVASLYSRPCPLFLRGAKLFFKMRTPHTAFYPLQGNPERPLLRENPGKFQKRAAPYPKRDSSEPLPQPDAPKTSGLSACKTGQAFAGYARGGSEDRSGKRPCRYRGLFPKGLILFFKSCLRQRPPQGGAKKAPGNIRAPLASFLKVPRFYAAQSAGNITSFRPCRPSWKDPWRVSFPRACRKSCIPW